MSKTMRVNVRACLSLNLGMGVCLSPYISSSRLVTVRTVSQLREKHHVIMTKAHNYEKSEKRITKHLIMCKISHHYAKGIKKETVIRVEAVTYHTGLAESVLHH